MCEWNKQVWNKQVMTMQVRIFQPAKSASQSGRAGGRNWQVQPLLATAREPEPLMGWIASGDSLSELGGKLRFATQEEAIAFVTRQGWNYTVEAPAERIVKPRNYLDNFRPMRPQDEERQVTSGGK